MNAQHTHFISARNRAKMAVYLLSALLLLLVFDLLLNFILIVILPGTATEALIELGESNSFETLQWVNHLLSLLLFISAAISFLMWLYCASQNLRSLGTARPEYTPGWAVGGFFIPLANLVLPCKAVQEIWVRSDPMLKQPGEESWQKSGSSSLLSWWWGFWVLSGIINRASSRFLNSANTAEKLFIAAKLEIVSDAFFIIAGVLAIMVIRGIDRRQELRARTLYRNDPPPPMFETYQV